MSELVDSHAHIQEPEFAEDREAVIEQARAAGVRTIIVPGDNIASSTAALELAERYDGVYATAGFHPHEAASFTPADIGRLEALLARPKCVAVGEIGLDFFRMLSPEPAQVATFEAQLSLAARLQLPVAVHCRDAWDALAETLAPWAQRVLGSYAGRPLGVLHYFSANLATAQRYCDLGFLISIHTSVTHPRASELREVAAALPLSSLVVETDSPYGAPQAFRGKRNQPAYVIEAAKQIAALKGISIEEVAAAASANAMRLFRLPVSAVSGVAP